ncbi:hypothetical protein QX204_24370 [Nocardia sp. PE-7]|uniref:hypothetical protein n=1 Tax=Nocardia sp. PE-7 TaxID=3058426 RepID=UPI00265908E1|nr:hypothetical protein [Nocardia sp. PE-7]WKG08179.1 hypothetical protein QX204_24370 [Nocardia sp. PE-7]
MATDDEGLMSDFGDRRFESAALWPLMSATDSVSTAAGIFMQGTKTRQLHAPAMAALCRSAVESSGRVIWMLSPEDRQVRRDRCTAIALAEMKEQTNHNSNEVAALRLGTISAPPEHKNEFIKGSKDLLDRYTQLEQQYTQNPDREKVRPFGKTAELAAEWVQDHVPAHDTGEIANNGMALGTKRIYGLTSAVMHGYKWVNDYLYNGDLFALLADSFATAVNLTECGIALYEAQAQNHADETTRSMHYPARLQPTVTEWSKLYPPTS